MGRKSYLEKSLLPVAHPDDVSLAAEPAPNTAAQISLAAPGSQYRWVLSLVAAYYTGGAPTPRELVIESPPGIVVHRVPMGSAADTYRVIPGEIVAPLGAGVLVSLPQGGVGVSGRLYVTARKVWTHSPDLRPD